MYGTIGVALSSRLDRAISPAAFGGQGIAGSIGHERHRGAYSVRLNVAASESSLQPLGGEASSRARFYFGDVAFGVQRNTGDHTRGFSFGAEVRGSLFLTRHRYADPQQSIATFVVAMATLSPTIAYQRPTFLGTARVHAGVPVAGLVSHPYSGLKSARRSLDFRGVTPTTLRSATAGVSLSAFATRSAGLLYEYELRLMDYDDVQPVRGVAQSVRIGMEYRFGARRR